MKPENDDLTPAVIVSGIISMVIIAVLFLMAWCVGVGLTK